MDNCLLDVVMKKCQDSESYVRSTSVKSLQVYYYTQVLGIDIYVKRITLNNPAIWDSKEKLVLFDHMIKLLEDNDISPRRYIECMFCLISHRAVLDTLCRWIENETSSLHVTGMLADASTCQKVR